ncbi:MAG: electron transport complex protein RnfG [Bacteroidia bacterium]|jgi:electron transport complex protein RnfG
MATIAMGGRNSMLGRSITLNSALLALFAVVTTSLIAGTFLSTKDAIAEQKRRAEERALLQIVPREIHDNSMLDDTLPVGPDTKGLGLQKNRTIYLARRENKIVAAIIPAVAPDGYTGKIEMIVGVNIDGSIAGVRVLAHRETPGLGDKVDLKKSDWVLGFNARSLSNPTVDNWAVKRDRGVFDQFTGATITPRAVVKATLGVLQFVQANREFIFGKTEPAANGGES